MKNKKATISPIAKDKGPVLYNWGDLQQEWSEAVKRSGENYFEIHRMDEHHVKSKQPVALYRLNVFIIFLISGREGALKIGSEGYSRKPGILCFVPANRFIPCMSKMDEQSGYFCAFTSSFFGQNLANKDSLFEYPFFNVEEGIALQLDNSQTVYFNKLFQEMEEAYQTEHANKENLIRALLNVLLQKAQQLIIANRDNCLVDNSNAGVRLTKAFALLFEKDLEPLKNLHTIEIKSLSQYATALHVTQNYLNDTIKAVTGQTPGEIIRERLIKEASQLLLHTQLSIAEICFLLKFEDASYFSRFFKRYTGVTPSQYRKKEEVTNAPFFARFSNQDSSK
ncbi:helix-turn-helix transcriptional regulator [Rhodocytophaga aerolata]|uniref:Helix-turn-helix transcriptional regulator n=1 Tax=Rhodocytophaga aerolata TaxID=455078 RepID=A0ABT8RDH2_9BACT|nr:AraC family transcriptional regulator [Rhodocytophaga aerolata]MDO1450137.1 helix-turn-helix transcriptional regulator [Rhodocytophaga aerolata]